MDRRRFLRFLPLAPLLPSVLKARPLLHVQVDRLIERFGSVQFRALVAPATSRWSGYYLDARGVIVGWVDKFGRVTAKGPA